MLQGRLIQFYNYFDLDLSLSLYMNTFKLLSRDFLLLAVACTLVSIVSSLVVFLAYTCSWCSRGYEAEDAWFRPSYCMKKTRTQLISRPGKNSLQAGQNFPPVWDGFPYVFRIYFSLPNHKIFPFCLFFQAWLVRNETLPKPPFICFTRRHQDWQNY